MRLLQTFDSILVSILLSFSAYILIQKGVDENNGALILLAKSWPDIMLWFFLLLFHIKYIQSISVIYKHLEIMYTSKSNKEGSLSKAKPELIEKAFSSSLVGALQFATRIIFLISIYILILSLYPKDGNHPQPQHLRAWYALFAFSSGYLLPNGILLHITGIQQRERLGRRNFWWSVIAQACYLGKPVQCDSLFNVAIQWLRISFMMVVMVIGVFLYYWSGDKNAYMFKTILILWLATSTIYDWFVQHRFFFNEKKMATFLID